MQILKVTTLVFFFFVLFRTISAAQDTPLDKEEKSSIGCGCGIGRDIGERGAVDKRIDDHVLRTSRCSSYIDEDEQTCGTNYESNLKHHINETGLQTN